MKQTIVCDAGTASSDGRTLTFLANSGTRMTNGYTVDLESLQAPVANSVVHKPVAELTDSDKLTLPLLVDQGEADEFMASELRPDLLQAACAASGHPLELRMQSGYDHSYYFIASFIGDHIAHHAAALKA